MSPRALVVEDERDVARLVAYHLQAARFEVDVVDTGEAAIAHAVAVEPDVVVLDVGLPGIDGFEVCRRLRADPRTARVGIVMLTARGASDDRVAGLEVGVDDFLGKPFVVRELVLRVQAVVGRTGGRAPVPPKGELLRAGTIEVDRTTHEVRVEGVAVALRALEYGVLVLLMTPPRRAYTRDEMLEAVWHEPHALNVRMVDVTVSRLRTALGPAGDMIETIIGHGYRIRRV